MKLGLCKTKFASSVALKPWSSQLWFFPPVFTYPDESVHSRIDIHQLHSLQRIQYQIHCLSIPQPESKPYTKNLDIKWKFIMVKKKVQLKHMGVIPKARCPTKIYIIYYTKIRITRHDCICAKMQSCFVNIIFELLNWTWNSFFLYLKQLWPMQPI